MVSLGLIEGWLTLGLLTGVVIASRGAYFTLLCSAIISQTNIEPNK